MWVYSCSRRLLSFLTRKIKDFINLETKMGAPSIPKITKKTTGSCLWFLFLYETDLKLMEYTDTIVSFIISLYTTSTCLPISTHIGTTKLGI